MTRERAYQLRELIKKASASLPDEDALDGPELFPAWEPGRACITGERLRYGAELYRVLQDHTAQADWTPEEAPSLYAKVLIPDPTQIPEWEQPDSTNPYAKGDKVTHNGKTWISTIDGNVWEPGVAGTETLWKEVSDAAT